jgi:pimeloyl-ACP methyl ester carboxylesterase
LAKAITFIVFVIMKKWLKRTGYTLLVLFMVLNVMVIFHARQFTHFYPDAPRIDLKNLSIGQKVKMVFMGYEFPKSKVTQTPDVPFVTITLTIADDLKISGWLIKNDSTRDAAILFHGHGSQKGSLIDQARYLRSLGYSILLIDFRAHGDSDGTTCTVGYNETEEVKTAFEFMREKGYEKIVLYGSSMGAAAVIKAVRDYQLDAHKLILEMSFGSLPDAVKGRMRIMGLPGSPLSQMLTFWGGVEHGYWAFNFSPCDYATELKMPVLVQWGDKDLRVQRYETECIYNNLGGQKKMVVYEGAGHQSLYKYDALKWEGEVSAFLKTETP